MSDEFPEYTEKAGSCKYCGNSPTNHWFTYAANTLNVRLGIILKSIEKSFWFVRYWRLMREVTMYIDAIGNWIFEQCGIVTYHDDIEDAMTYRSRVVWEEAKRRGIAMQQAKFFGVRTELYRATYKDRWEHFLSLPMHASNEPIPDWLHDKVLVKELLGEMGIAVPRARGVENFEQAKNFFEEVSRPVIVKPRAGTRGRHTTTNICTLEDLKKAVSVAKVLCGYVSIEEHLEGSVCRATVVDGKLVGFLKADPPIVVGDGVSVLRALIDQQNKTRPARVAQIVITDEILEHIARSGITLESVIPRDTRVHLTHRTGRLFGGSTTEMFAGVHPELRAQVELAARGLRASILGFDLIIGDPEKDPATQKWGIIEVNTLPFIDLHYLPLYGEPSNVAAQVWDLWEKA